MQAARLVVIEADPGQSEQVRRELLERGLPARPLKLAEAAEQSLFPDVDLAVVVGGSQPAVGDAAVQGLVGKLLEAGIPTVTWGLPETLSASQGVMLEAVSPACSIDDLMGRVTALSHCAPMLKRMDTELKYLQRVGEQFNRYFEQIDQEMRLAGRLQREFLPACPPDLPPLKFATLYRPASWVSGDTYNVFRIHETVAGIFLADAMGHGTAAGLITMFLRQALTSKEITRDGLRVLPPAEVLDRIHRDLLRQALPSSQFVTATYAALDARTLELQVARAAHPRPLLIQQGRVTALEASGGLLGVPEIDPEFIAQTVQLSFDDRLIFYSDGLESTLVTRDDNDQLRPTPQLESWLHLPGEEFVAAIDHFLDEQTGSLNPTDDVTMILVDIQRLADS